MRSRCFAFSCPFTNSLLLNLWMCERVCACDLWWFRCAVALLHLLQPWIIPYFFSTLHSCLYFSIWHTSQHTTHSHMHDTLFHKLGIPLCISIYSASSAIHISLSPFLSSCSPHFSFSHVDLVSLNSRIDSRAQHTYTQVKVWLYMPCTFRPIQHYT